MVRYRVHKSPPRGCIVIEINLFHAIPFLLLEIQVNIFLPFMLLLEYGTAFRYGLAYVGKYLATVRNLPFRAYQLLLHAKALLGLYRIFGAIICKISGTDSTSIHTQCQGTPQ
jgi:hypothetical protein